MLASVLLEKNKVSKTEEVKTKSGLKILFLEDQSLPYIEFKLHFLQGGSDYDFADKKGLSFLTGELLDQGASGMDSEALQEQVNYYGTGFSVSTAKQMTSLSMGGLNQYAKQMWSLFLKIVTESHLDKKEFNLLVQNALQDRYQLLDHSSSVADELWFRFLFNKSQEGSLGASPEGTITSLKEISLENVKSFYSEYYKKSSPILSVVGQFDAELKKYIIDSFSESFSRHEDKPSLPVRLKESSFFKLLHKKDEVQSQVLIGFPASPFPKDKPQDFMALILANLAFGSGGMNNRLFLKLREEMGLTYGAHSQLSLGKFYGYFMMSGATKTESTSVYIKESLKLLQDFQSQGITQEELDKSKKTLKGYYLKSIETPEKRINRFIYYVSYLGLSPSYLDNYLSLLEKISLKEVNKVIQEYLNTSQLNILVMGNPSLEKSLSQIKGLSPLESNSFEDYFSKELSLKD